MGIIERIKIAFKILVYGIKIDIYFNGSVILGKKSSSSSLLKITTIPKDIRIDVIDGIFGVVEDEDFLKIKFLDKFKIKSEE